MNKMAIHTHSKKTFSRGTGYKYDVELTEFCFHFSEIRIDLNSTNIS